MQYLQEQFQQYLQNYTFKKAPENLYAACSHILAIGGKRVRPVALLLSNNLFGDTTEDAMHAALAIELFHNFTLIHDDIMDAAPLRRGEQTVHHKWNMPTAILAGDVMNIYAYAALNKINATYVQACLEVFNRTAIEVCEGQQMDMDFELRTDVSIAEYIEMITLKTSVLLACSIQLGAILGGATQGTSSLLYEFGKNLGISFQIKDDYLDAFGNAQKTGKQVGGDILSNKKTFLLLKCLEKADVKQRARLHQLLASDDDSKVSNVLQMYTELSIREEAMQLKEHYSQLAFTALDNVAVPDSRKQEMRTLAEFLLNRDH
jgi:geranylgeranyl diphosphate synthase, type II